MSEKLRPKKKELKDTLIYFLNLVLEEEQMATAIPLLFARIDQTDERQIRKLAKNLQALQTATDDAEQLLSLSQNLYEEGLETLFVLAGLPPETIFDFLNKIAGREVVTYQD
ncbi:MAG: hypothetical protein A2383_04150 [Candidatus Pacebacteria bacterium RIFOXYB1_FULL_39_46]|nr:MAG: hypothetical protein A2383_04150 [Candidatus Pacebacteria bacterium RIFOXYB1_FULL_39_46]OGJ39147.1 MAG: hypothetical protein A2182_02395 [Candidatus Pacebacteria bacterium RIFOXYA1_FULL_38_18]OGJ40153.1 MAG: hypothetical protein A2582_03615 [Candidatus Pacebacteria bacterium RIFOXYD1_FULL_39_27]OGJ41038.1 MAG: hypothetical protein A2411_00965 [Candidatus Pacebacteria bacterium RIFOXYC1_FULL_39_21]